MREKIEIKLPIIIVLLRKWKIVWNFECREMHWGFFLYLYGNQKNPNEI